MNNQVKSWWFLLPEHGVAIELCDGACISWDGRVLMHCSSCPVATVDLYSVWSSVPAAVLKRHAEDSACAESLKKRAAPRLPGEPSHHVTFERGEVARLLWRTKGSEQLRSYKVTVQHVSADGHVQVREPTGRGSVDTLLTPHQVQIYLAK